MGRSVKTALQAALTLGLVSGIYASTWILAATGAAPPPLVDAFEGYDDRFAEVVWVPDSPETESEPATEQPASEASSDAGTTTAAAATPGAPQATATDDNAVPDTLVVANTPKPTLRPRKRVRRGKRVVKRGPPRELTKKQKRRRERRKRVRERLAKQPQCHELIDQIVPVEDDEWLVGRDLASCYRAHPRQFMHMGGMRWVEDDDDKRVGLRISLSRHERADIARAVGFRRGDVLRSLNGVPLRSTLGSSFAVAQLVGGKAKVKFIRDGEEHRVVFRVVGERKLERAREKNRQDQLAGLDTE